MSARQELFDLERLRKNWSQTDANADLAVSERAKQLPATAEPELTAEVPLLLDLLRQAIAFEFGANYRTLLPFLTQVEQAAGRCLQARSAASELGLSTGSEPMPAGGQAYPELELEEALGSLEDMLDVFLTVHGQARG